MILIVIGATMMVIGICLMLAALAIEALSGWDMLWLAIGGGIFAGVGAGLMALFGLILLWEAVV